jgi:hypothetical protein
MSSALRMMSGFVTRMYLRVGGGGEGREREKGGGGE